MRTRRCIASLAIQCRRIHLCETNPRWIDSDSSGRLRMYLHHNAFKICFPCFSSRVHLCAPASAPTGNTPVCGAMHPRLTRQPHGTKTHRPGSHLCVRGISASEHTFPPAPTAARLPAVLGRTSQNFTTPATTYRSTTRSHRKKRQVLLGR